jgi:glycolate oxidase FAD binding subunit
VVTLLAAPDAFKAGIDVWGQEPATLDIMRALKREFDPAGILNPGCFVGSI